jgi:hypothetical protein
MPLALLGGMAPAMAPRELVRPLEPVKPMVNTPEAERNKKAWFNMMRSFGAPANGSHLAVGLEAPPAPVMWAVTGQYGDSSREIQKYNSTTGTWTPDNTTFTHALHNSANAWMMGIWYLVGGEDAAGPTYKGEKFDPITHRWYSIRPMKQKRTLLAGCAVRGYIYAVGGMDCKSGLSTCHALASVEKYNTLVDEWYEVSPMKTPRVGAIAAQMNKKLYVMGGYNGDPKDDDPDRMLDSVEVYDPELDTWKDVTPMKQARRFSGIAMIAMAPPGTPAWKIALAPKHLLAVGGEKLGIDGSRIALASVEKYDPKSDSWSAFTPLSTARNSPKVSAVDGKIYVLGASSSEEYDPNTDTWSSSHFPVHTTGSGKVVLYLGTSGVLSPARKMAHQIATAEGRLQLYKDGDVERYCMTTAAVESWALDPRGGFVAKANAATLTVSYAGVGDTVYPTLGTCQNLSYYKDGPFVMPIAMMIDPYSFHYPAYSSFKLVPEYYQPLLTILGEHTVEDMWPAHKIFVHAAAEAYNLPDMEPLATAPTKNLTFDDFVVVGYSTVGADPYHVLHPHGNGFAVRVPKNATFAVGGVPAVHYKQHLKNYELRAKISYTGWHSPAPIGSRFPNTGFFLSSKINFSDPNQISPWFTASKVVIQPWGGILELYYAKSADKDMCMPDEPAYDSLVADFPNTFYMIYQALGNKLRVWIGEDPTDLQMMTYMKEARPVKKEMAGMGFLLDKVSSGSPGLQIQGTNFEATDISVRPITTFSGGYADRTRDFYQVETVRDAAQDREEREDWDQEQDEEEEEEGMSDTKDDEGSDPLAVAP